MKTGRSRPLKPPLARQHSALGVASLRSAATRLCPFHFA